MLSFFVLRKIDEKTFVDCLIQITLKFLSLDGQLLIVSLCKHNQEYWHYTETVSFRLRFQLIINISLTEVIDHAQMLRYSQ